MPKGFPKSGVNKGWFSKGDPRHIKTPEHSAKVGAAVSRALKGRAHTKEHNAKIAAGMKGKNSNEENPAWKGPNVKYMGLHNWVRRHFGTPSYCESCGTEEPRMYHWANRSGQYLRDREDWLRLCVPCHKKYDSTSKNV